MGKRSDFEIPVEVRGLRFRNPFYVSSGPTTMTIEQLERIQATGWAAASLKLTVYPLPYINRHPRYGWYPEKGFLAFTAERRLLLDELLRLIEAGRQRCPDLILFANITYAGDDGAEGWVAMARQCEAAGAHVIELNMCCPNMSFNVELTGAAHGGPRTGASMGREEDVAIAVVAAVKRAVQVPVFLKLTPEGGRIAQIAKAAFAAGADAAGGAANRLGVPPIDLGQPTRSMYYLQEEIGMACMNGPWLKPLALRDVYETRKAVGPDRTLTATGGVFDWPDAIEMAMCGADLIGICTATIVNGFGFMPEFIAGVRRYMREKGYRNWRELRDLLVPAITAAPQLTIYAGNARLVEPRPVAPCAFACPAAVPAQGYVRRVAEEDFEGAYQLIMSRSPLPATCGEICDHPCETACTRGLKDAPVMIRAIKRFVLETAAKEGWQPQPLVAASGRPRRKVAIVGAGPAGLSAAYDLARAGYAVTIFEAAAEPGGMLRYGIPAYRLCRDTLERELAAIRALGVEFRTGRRLGSDFTLETLRQDGFEAVFLGLGAPSGRRLGIAGEDAAGSRQAVDLLRRVAAGERPDLGQRVVVIGGGFTAVDAARTARRLGAEKVYIAYRRTRAEMPATAEEVDEAEEEGVRVIYLVAPTAILVENGRVRGVRLLNHVLDDRDASGRRRPVEVPGTEFTLPVDTVIAAVGQAAEDCGTPTTAAGTIAVDEHTLATSLAGVFAGGDCVLGPKNVISAIAHGKRAAVSIDKYLAGSAAVLEYEPPTTEADKEAALRRAGAQPRRWRQEESKRPAAERVRDFGLYAQPLSRQQAVEEASRCLACGCGAGCQICYNICKMFAYALDAYGRVRLDEEKCVACGMCIHRCPNHVIEMVRTSDAPI